MLSCNIFVDSKYLLGLILLYFVYFSLGNLYRCDIFVSLTPTVNWKPLANIQLHFCPPTRFLSYFPLKSLYSKLGSKNEIDIKLFVVNICWRSKWRSCWFATTYLTYEPTRLSREKGGNKMTSSNNSAFNLKSQFNGCECFIFIFFKQLFFPLWFYNCYIINIIFLFFMISFSWY